jgi:hypothetical protein
MITFDTLLTLLFYIYTFCIRINIQIYIIYKALYMCMTLYIPNITHKSSKALFSKESFDAWMLELFFCFGYFDLVRSWFVSASIRSYSVGYGCTD